jgi:2'-5' RNA ligase
VGLCLSLSHDYHSSHPGNGILLSVTAPSTQYRIFVGAFPTGDLAERIQALRLRHDAKTARITPPHVTLAGTYWRAGLPTAEQEGETMQALAAVQASIEPFELVLGGIEAFPPNGQVIYLAVEPTAGLLAARRQLLQVLGADKHHHFTPHLTLTMRLSAAASKALLAELRQTEWHTARWSQRGPHDPAWRAIQELPLGSPREGDVHDSGKAPPGH